jgi:hypothetical protein
MNLKNALKKFWHFIWEDDSIWSWVVNVILAFVLIKFIVYPGLGFVFQTSHPVVAVVSESMEHDALFESWWPNGGKWYAANSITEEEFGNFDFRNGFNKGDIMVLFGKSAKDVEVGDVIVFWSTKRDPIIHRVVEKEDDGGIVLKTKGDNYRTNPVPIKSPGLDETHISEEQIIGKAVFRIPFLGYIKIWFVELIGMLQKAV